jgi:cell division protein FtsI (penicillin-binding protein 3)
MSTRLDQARIGFITGTAQKADYVRGGYADGKWISSFIGYAPAERPRLVVGVVIDEPMIAHYGGTVAGTTFRRVMDAGLRHLGVVARTPEQEPAAARKKSNRRANSQETKPEEAAQSVSVSETSGALASAVARRVPDLLGQTARKALLLSQEAELSIRLDGSGLVIEQTPAPNDVVEKGSTIHVVLKPPGDRTSPVPLSPELADTEAPAGSATTASAEIEPKARPEKLRARADGRDG